LPLWGGEGLDNACVGGRRRLDGNSAKRCVRHTPTPGGRCYETRERNQNPPRKLSTFLRKTRRYFYFSVS
jgi:hypothetical protein